METKIEVAIYDTKLRIKKVEQDIMLLLREKETLEKQVTTLEHLEKDDSLK